MLLFFVYFTNIIVSSLVKAWEQGYYSKELYMEQRGIVNQQHIQCKETSKIYSQKHVQRKNDFTYASL